MIKNLKSVFGLRCPRCHEGKLFSYSLPKSFNQLWEMPKHCSKCGLDFEPEPGFWFGSMFVSYIVSGWAGLILFFTLYKGLHLTFDAALIVVVIILLLSIPVMFRFSRALYIHIVRWVKADKA